MSEITREERREAIEFLRRDGWVISHVEHSDVPRVMVEFSKLKNAALQHERDAYKKIAEDAISCMPTPPIILPRTS